MRGVLVVVAATAVASAAVGAVVGSGVLQATPAAHHREDRRNATVPVSRSRTVAGAPSIRHTAPTPSCPWLDGHLPVSTRVDEVLAASLAREEKEAVKRAKLRAGERSYDLDGLRAVVGGS